MEKIVKDKAVILRLNEDLIASNIKRFNINVMELLEEEEGNEELVLDVGAAENIDSVGVTFVIGLYKNAKSEGKSFKVINSSDDVMQLFKLMKLDKFFELEG